MAKRQTFSYTQAANGSGFSKALGERMEAYFQERGLSKHANGMMRFKTILGFAMWTGSWIWLMKGAATPLQVLALFTLHGFTQLYMTFNIAHDANHGAYSKRKRVNRLLSYVFDLVGVSSYMWRLLHNDAHHAFVNIRGADTTFLSGNLFRFSADQERRWHHRYQHLYAPFIYSLSTLDWALTKDYRWLAYDLPFGNRTIIKHSRVELLFLFLGKAFYYTTVLAIPMRYLPVPWHVVLVGFLVMHLFIGFTIALIFQPNHFNAHATFPLPDGSGRIHNNHTQHIFDTTLDYARANRAATWLLGCLNLHIVHHMYAGICHVHYPALTEVLRTTAAEHGLVYRECRTLTGAFLGHLKWLKALGRGSDLPEAIPAAQASEV